MQISVNSTIRRLNSRTREAIRRSLQDTLDRLSSRISRVTVSVIDENGPRGGVDKVCRVNLVMEGFGGVTATGKSEQVMVAVAEAARRARRKVRDKLKRRIDRRQRVRTRPAELAAAAVADADADAGL